MGGENLWHLGASAPLENIYMGFFAKTQYGPRKIWCEYFDAEYLVNVDEKSSCIPDGATIECSNRSITSRLFTHTPDSESESWVFCYSRGVDTPENNPTKFEQDKSIRRRDTVTQSCTLRRFGPFRRKSLNLPRLWPLAELFLEIIFKIAKHNRFGVRCSVRHTNPNGPTTSRYLGDVHKFGKNTSRIAIGTNSLPDIPTSGQHSFLQKSQAGPRLCPRQIWCEFIYALYLGNVYENSHVFQMGRQTNTRYRNSWSLFTLTLCGSLNLEYYSLIESG